ncbi:MAG: TRAP transporter small permease subunit [Acidobacteriota bacterium]
MSAFMRVLTFYLARAVGVVLALLLAALVALATLETVAWALFEVSWPQTSEISGLLLVWFGFLGAAYGIHGRVHLGVEIVIRRLPRPWRDGVLRLASALVALFGVLVAFYGAALTSRVGNTLPATGLSAAVQYFPAVVAGALMAVFALEEVLTGPDQAPPAEDRDASP